MTVNYTTNLALGQPVTGTESGTWGDDVNNAVTSYLDIAIAGGLAITVTTADVTLTLTQGTSSATNIGSTTAQYAILNVSGAMTAARNLILPSSSRQYVINNACTGGFLLTVKGSATTGVTMVNGEKAHVFWNGSDYAKVSNSQGGAGTFSSITNTGLTSGRVVYSTAGGLETDSANLLYSGTDLTVYGLTVGRGAGAVATNTAVGASALQANTTSANSTAVGYQTLYSQVAAGSFNTAFGSQAGYNTTAQVIDAFGYQALYANTSGGDSQAFGFRALYSNTTGVSNVALGREALLANTTASNNTAVGYQAGYTSTTGAFNVFIGTEAGYTNATGAYNTFVGYQAGRASNFNGNAFNTCVGYYAGGRLTTGVANTFIGSANNGTGYTSGGDITTGSRNTIIGSYSGNNGGLDIRTASNYIVLSDGDGNPRGIFDGSGNFRIGVTGVAYNTEGLTVFKTGNAESAAFVNDAGVNNFTVAVSNRATTGDNKFMVFATEGNDTTRGYPCNVG